MKHIYIASIVFISMFLSCVHAWELPACKNIQKKLEQKENELKTKQQMQMRARMTKDQLEEIEREKQIISEEIAELKKEKKRCEQDFAQQMNYKK